MSHLLLLGLLIVCAEGHNNYNNNKPSFSYPDVAGTPYTVGWDEHAILINGQRTLIQSGSVHYQRSTPDMWPDILARTRASGLNAVQIFVIWNYHESVKRQYDFSTENRNLPLFLQNIADAGLFVNLRIGPYACAEWNYGGFPMWLRDEPGMVFPTDNEPWKKEMQIFMDYVIKLVDPYLARNGGSIIMAQVENEYGNIEKAYGEAAARYVNWAVNLVNGYQLDIPWIMCQQNDAPLSVIATCNGFYCDDWLSNHLATRKQPGMWTENWNGWFQDWGQAQPTRPVEDVVFAVARFVARGGTFHNYYMFHGGTTFGRHTGGPWYVTSYDYDAALNQYGVPHEPKYSHSTALHNVLQTYSGAIVAQDAAIYSKLGNGLESHAFGSLGTSGSIVFLSNLNTHGSASIVTFYNNTYILPLWSVTLVDGATFQTVYCTAKIAPQHQVLGHVYQQRWERRHGHEHAQVTSIKTWNEPIGAWDTPVVAKKPLEHLSVVKDTSDFLWYQTSVVLTQDQIDVGSVSVTVSNVQDYFEIFFNSVSIGTGRAIAGNTTLNINVSSSTPGTYPLAIACQTNGLINYGTFLEKYARGILGTVSWSEQDVTASTWLHVPGLKGEKLEIWSHDGSRNVPWAPYNGTTSYQWYKLSLPPVSQRHGTDPKVWALDMGGMGKGMVWVNGHMLGRYWLLTATGTCNPNCSYVGTFDPNSCRVGCGEPAQRYYHIPRAWLNAVGNVVTVFEEQIKVDPTTIKIAQMN